MWGPWWGQGRETETGPGTSAGLDGEGGARSPRPVSAKGFPLLPRPIRPAVGRQGPYGTTQMQCWAPLLGMNPKYVPGVCGFPLKGGYGGRGGCGPLGCAMA